MTSTLKAGMVGLDTSHCQAFIEVLHDPASPYHIPGVRVTGVYAGGSEQFSLSRERVKNFSTYRLFRSSQSEQSRKRRSSAGFTVACLDMIDYEEE